MAWQDVANRHVTTPVILISLAFSSGTRYYSNEYVRTSSRLYKGNVLNFPQIRSSIGGLTRTYERNTIRILFNDTDREMRTLEDSGVTFKNVVVSIISSFQDDSYATSLTFHTGQIKDWRRLDNLQFEIEIEEKSLNLENVYPSKRVDRGDYPNAHDSAVGWVIPIPYGTVAHPLGAGGNGAYGHPSISTENSGTGLLFVDTTVNSEKHLVGIQKSGQAITVTRLFKNGTLQTLATHYTVSNSTVGGYEHTVINWVSGVNPTETSFISADVSFGSRRPVEGFRHFLETFCGYTAGMFNAASYTAATAKETDRGYSFDGVFWKPEKLQTIFDDFREEFQIDIYWNKAGEICFNYITAVLPTSINSYKDLADILETSFDSDPHAGEIINKQKYGYNYHYSRNYFYNNPTYEDTDSQAKYGQTYEGEFKQLYFTRSATQALDLAARKIIRFKDPIVFDTMMFPLRTFSDNLSDIIKITHFGGVGAAGYVEKYFQIRATEYDIDNYVNSLLLEDAASFIGKACILGDGTVLPALWTGASGAQRDYCYLCDNTTKQFSDGLPGKRLFD